MTQHMCFRLNAFSHPWALETSECLGPEVAGESMDDSPGMA